MTMRPSIRPDRSLIRPAVFSGMALAILVAAGLRWRAVDVPRANGTTRIAAEAPVVAPSAIPEAVSMPAFPTSTPPRDEPTSLTPREWAAVEDRSAAASQPEQEAARMARYIAFQKTYFEWRALARGQDPARRDALGQQLLDGLPTQVQQGDVAVEQARAVQEEVLTARIPDAAQRAPLLAIEHERLPAPAVPASAPQQAFH